MKNLPIYIGISLLLVAVGYVTVGVLSEYEKLANFGLAMTIVLLGAFPSLVLLTSRVESALIPLMPLHGLYYAMSYGVTTLFGDLDSSNSQIRPALEVTVVGLVFLNIGFYAFRKFYSNVSSFKAFADVSPTRQKWVGWVMLGIYLVFQSVPKLKALPSVGHLEILFLYLSLGLLFTLALDYKLPKKQIWLLGFAIFFILVTKTLSGTLAPAIFLTIFLGIIYWSKRKVIPWALILAGAIFVVTLNPVKHHYRAVAWDSDIFSKMSYSERAVLFYEALQIFYERDLFSSLSEDTSTIERVSRVSTLSHVISMTPDTVPYWAGESYRTLLTSFIPRVLWPGKPEATIGQEFGHRYSLLSRDDETTSYNLPWLAEFYANFGLVGVVFGMLLVGILFRFIVQKMSAPISENISFILGLTISFTLFYADSNFALLVGGVLLKFLAGFSLLWLLTANYVWKRKL